MASRKLERFSETVEFIYAASLSPALWQQAVGAIARQHDAPMANLLTPLKAPSDGGYIFSVGFAESMLQLWSSKFVSHDIWAQRVVERNLAKEGTVLISSDLVTDDEFERSYFYREFLKHHDVWHLCTGIVFDGTEAPLTAISLFRPRKGRSFETLDRDLYRLTVNHVSRSLGTMLVLRDAEVQVQATLASLHRFDTAVVLLGRRGNVVFVNQSARCILQTGDGLRLRVGNPMIDGEGWLSATDPADEDRLTRLLKTCLNPLAEAEHFHQGVAVHRSSGKMPYVVQASALAAGNELCTRPGDTSAIAFITDPERTPNINAALLRAIYGLTAAEANLACELVKGDGVAATANRLHITENTVKSQLAAVYEKTGTHRQAELVKLLLGLASSRMDAPKR